MWSVWQTCRTGRRAAGFLGGLLVALLLAAGPAAGQTFSDPPMTLSNGGGATTPAVAVTSSGKVYAAWVEGGKILFSRSKTTENSCGAAAGLEFETPVALSSGTGIASLPAIAANGNGGVFVAWQIDDFPANPAIYFKRSLNHGEAFQAAVKLSQDASSASFPSAAADDAGGVFVAWQDMNFSTSTSSVVVAQSTNGGETLPSATVFSVSGFGFFQPAVASDGSRVHVVWNDVALLGVWYRGFDRGTVLSNVIEKQLTTALALYPKISAQANQVTAAWVELAGSKVKSRTMTSGQPFGGELEVYAFSSPTGSVSNLSLSSDNAGRFFAWQQNEYDPDPLKSYSAIGYLLGNGPATIRWKGSLTANLAAPSVGQHGTDRLVTTWQENGRNFSPEVKLAHTGGSGSPGGGMDARVWIEPRVLNYRTMGRGTGQQPNLTVFIELPVGTIDPASVKMKVEGKDGEYSPLPHPSALGDHDGNGVTDLMVKFNRSIFDGAGVATAVQSTGNYTVGYTVTGNTTTGGCFASKVGVQIVR